MVGVISKNSEILLLYEAKLTNPNGDPDDENRPRMDPKTKRNLVSDVRLKRYFRDYVEQRLGNARVWVAKVDEKSVDATQRLAQFGNDPDRVMRECIDARLFGATFTKKAEGRGEKGESIAYAGPVQFSWGFSLHPVDIVDSRSITSVFSGAQVGYGTIGKDYRVYYSLIAFYGAVSAARAKATGATDDDLKLLDNSLWDALVTETVTRSKIGQRPLLYLRAEHREPEHMLGDLRRFVRATPRTESVRDLSDLELDLSGLVPGLGRPETERVYLRCAEDLQGVCGVIRSLPGKVQDLPHRDVAWK
ncbi:MAG: type I-B CRISPR-associated protein Cas7/Csh2 [Conexivisphaerales archaeon]|nr:type I-B CRISPR-associated protein Cas7/Csh2 [Conexivisphaerales archaeon]